MKAFEELERLFAKSGICVAVKEKLTKDSGVAGAFDYNHIVAKLLAKPKARGTIFLNKLVKVINIDYGISNLENGNLELISNLLEFRRGLCMGEGLRKGIWGEEPIKVQSPSPVRCLFQMLPNFPQHFDQNVCTLQVSGIGFKAAAVLVLLNLYES